MQEPKLGAAEAAAAETGARTPAEFLEKVGRDRWGEGLLHVHADVLRALEPAA